MTNLPYAIEAAIRAVPPAFPLEATVAVNPFFGQAGMDLAGAAAHWGRAAGIRLALPRTWYRERVMAGAIGMADLEAALLATPDPPVDLAGLMSALGEETPPPVPVPTVAGLASDASGIDWEGIVADRIGHWAGGWADAGQALWTAGDIADAWSSWRATAIRDLTPELLGLEGFAAYVDGLPLDAPAAVARLVDELGAPEAALESLFHRALATLSGWAQLGRYRLWEAELAGGTDATLAGMLAIRLAYDAALLRQYRHRIASAWAEALAAHAAPAVPSEAQRIDAILQDAADRAAQRALKERLEAPQKVTAIAARAAVQAAFCIDVRSEVFRRALESVAPEIETIGFAGFFGLGVAHRAFASDVAEKRLPVLLNPGLTTAAVGPAEAAADASARISARATRAWGRFARAAVSSFAFVEAAGPLHLGKLLRDSFGWKRAAAPDPAPRPDPALPLAERIATAATVLRAMSLTRNFAPIVLLAGHGGQAANNPHLSALHCGACGGYAGDVNARLLALLLNDPDVRGGLSGEGILIPADSWFLAGLHDTTTDEMTLYAADWPSPAHGEALRALEARLAEAGRLARSERALRLPRAGGEAAVKRRASDWAEVRPEWALAGCKAFIAAPRARTTGRDLGGRAFLHSYDWQADEGFKVLELILTAPVVVASWISLQYYGSVVAPELFGGGNKLLHNVVGGIGVIEGNGGPLRTGLPWQSVHDGERFQHEPLRLSVVVEAPREAMCEIIARHPHVRDLFDHGWLHLFQMDGDGRLVWKYGEERERERAARLKLVA
jgi:hypothetical protein